MEAQEKVTEGVKHLLGDPRKAILKLSIPMMMGMFAQALYNIVDAIWVAGLGADALAAVGLFFPVFMIFMALAGGIGVGGSSAISRRIGQRNKKAADNTADHAIMLSIIVSLALSLPFLPFLKEMFSSMGARGNVAQMASNYARVLFGGAIFLFFSNVANAILRGEGDTKRAMYAMILGAGLNVVLDPIYIYTLKMGVVGAAWATVTSMVVSVILFFYWLFIKRDTYVEINLREFHPDKKIIKEISKVGIPASLAQLSMSISMFLLNLVVIKAGGTDGVAVFTSGWRIVMLGTIPLVGIAMGVTAVTGAAYGARNPEKLETAYIYAIKIGVLIELGMAIIIILFAPQVAFIFTYSKGAARIADDLVDFLRWMAPFYLTVPLGMLSSAMFQGVRKGETALLVTILRTIILQVPAAYLFGIFFGFGLTGVWLGIIVGNAIAVSIAFTLGRLFVRDFFKIKHQTAQVHEKRFSSLFEDIEKDRVFNGGEGKMIWRNTKSVIHLIPLGKVEKDLLNYLASQISQIFSCSVEIEKSLPEPEYAYDRRRNQYYADPILKKLEQGDWKEKEKMLGIVDLDLYTSGLNFVFGEASLNGKVAIIALPRLREGFYGLSDDKDLYYRRALKEAVHELGHTFGLNHCQYKRCVMYFSNSLYDTDRKGEGFCKDCRKKLSRRQMGS